jgi:alkanesulfonate monooxygenase SsuD/methylene tetrahydromethanopterin reductase-like flavin-dependent oxidoreductase (luciferase family)
MQIGAIVRTGSVAEDQPPARYAVVRDMAQRMEAVGVDSIWVYDHLLYRRPDRPTDGIWECWTVLAALAEATQHVGIGPLVACTQFRNPALLAKMAVTLDEVSDGRLTLGLGAGWNQPEFDAFGIPFDLRVSRFAEAIDVIKPLLIDGRVDYDGTYYAAHDCELVPRGPRPGSLPLLLAGSGPRMRDLVARYADSSNSGWYVEPASAIAPLDEIRAACEHIGRDPRTLEMTISVPLVYPDLGRRTAGGEYLTGDADEVATALHAFEALGVSQAIVEFSPFTPAALERFAEAVRRFHE